MEVPAKSDCALLLPIPDKSNASGGKEDAPREKEVVLSLARERETDTGSCDREWGRSSALRPRGNSVSKGVAGTVEKGRDCV